MTDTRPATSRPRGVCKYYNSPTGCLAGRTCKFLHGDEKVTPYDKAKVCKFFAAGFCKRGTDCWFVHEQQSQPRSGSQQQDIVEDQSDDDLCCICFEKPTTYGLLGKRLPSHLLLRWLILYVYRRMQPHLLYRGTLCASTRFMSI